MDCEKFETLLIDELYGELDEVTSAAVRRHAAGCARCGALLSGLRATRKVAALPVEEPSPDLEDRILSAVREQQKILPFRARASTVLSRAGAWAMRPQTAMAAVFLLVIGTSFVLVQSRSDKRAPAMAAANAEGAPMALSKNSPASSAYVLDGNESAFAHGLEEKRAEPRPAATTAPSFLAADEQQARGEAKDKRDDDGKKELAANNSNDIANASPIAGATRTTDITTAETGHAANGPRAQGGGGGSGGWDSPNGQPARVPPQIQATQSQAPYGSGGVSFNSAKQLFDQRRYREARAQWDNLGDANSQLWAGRSEKAENGCTVAATQRFDGASHAGGSVGGEALLEAGRCYRAMGNSSLARARYSTCIGLGGANASTCQTELDAMTPTAAAHKAAEARTPVSVTATPQATTTQQAQPAQPAQKAAGY